MSNSPNKSATTVTLDALRWVLVIAVTVAVTRRLWNWHWLAALLAAYPVYLLAMNGISFATIPFYAMTPEARQARRLEQEILGAYATKFWNVNTLINFSICGLVGAFLLGALYLLFRTTFVLGL